MVKPQIVMVMYRGHGKLGHGQHQALGELWLQRASMVKQLHKLLTSQSHSIKPIRIDPGELVFKL